MKINGIMDAKTFVGNAGVEDWTWTGNASAEGFARWISANCTHVDRTDYANELYAYLVSAGENPEDYSATRHERLYRVTEGDAVVATEYDEDYDANETVYVHTYTESDAIRLANAYDRSEIAPDNLVWDGQTIVAIQEQGE